MMTENARVIKPLTLTQDRTYIDDDTQVIRWYGWSLASGITWGAEPHCPSGDDPDYICDVTVPALMCGTPDEISADIALALRRHSAKLDLN